jgi:hypothetical protein
VTRERGRYTPTNGEGAFRDEWFAVETESGNAVSGVDGVFDFESEQQALDVVGQFALETGKALTVVGYTRVELGTYKAVTKVEKVQADSTE